MSDRAFLLIALCIISGLFGDCLFHFKNFQNHAHAFSYLYFSAFSLGLCSLVGPL